MEVIDAIDLKNRLIGFGTLYKLEHLQSLPNCFTSNVFSFKPTIRFNIVNLLKDWVSSSTTAGDQDDCQIDEDNEIDTDCEDFKNALEKLNETIKPENLEALEKIKNETNEQRPGDGMQQRLSEDQIVVGIGVHLIKKLTGKALSSPARCAIKCPCGCDEKLDEQRKMFIGSPETWHGQLDLVSDGVGLTVTRDPIDMENEEDEDDKRNHDDGDAASIQSLERSLSVSERTNLEFKQDVSGKKLAGQLQVISQCIVFGWMEYNRHPDISPFIPSLYLDSSKFAFYIYNPPKDYLLIADHSSWFIAEDRADKYAGIFFLWVILNHRLFFRRKQNSRLATAVGVDIECGFHKNIRLEPYKQLKEFQYCVKNNTEGIDQKPEHCVELCPSVSSEKSRKRKLSDNS